ncbi:hypothetical protein Ciccas_001070 [Cichlidogyrus casuarinus]|uniref:VWFA domain-containing protein n=1 Tax=Cichlidogyrus casuarinus TaxID=1844966 RepID=A0ABD2QLL4_9PLAT
MAFSRETGELSNVVFEYKQSTHGDKCLPKLHKQIWVPNCGHVGPKVVHESECIDGNIEVTMEEKYRGMCSCKVKRWVYKKRCSCPAPIRKIKCMDGGRAVGIMLITFELCPKTGVCVKRVNTETHSVRCQVPKEFLTSAIPHLLAEGNSTFKVPESQLKLSADYSKAVKVFACGSGEIFRCSYYRATPDKFCKCRVITMHKTEACCCPTANDLFKVDEFERQALAENREPDSVTCNRLDNLLIRTKKHYELRANKCWPQYSIYKSPVECTNEENRRMLTPCKQGSQKFEIIKTIPKGCRCVKIRKIISKPCVCSNMGPTEVIVLIDESLGMAHEHFHRNVKTFLADLVMQYESNKDSAMHRFALIKYCEEPRVALDLDDPQHKILPHIQKLDHFLGRSDLAKALRLAIVPKFRENAAKLLFVITDGRHRITDDALTYARDLVEKDVKVNMVAFQSDNPSNNINLPFLHSLASKPEKKHIFVLKHTSELEKLPELLISSNCNKGCPQSSYKQIPCSLKTNCVGKMYEHTYRFDQNTNVCVGTTKLHQWRCCCPHKPLKRVTCSKDGKRHMMETMTWTLSSNNVCVKQHTRADVGGCTPEGFAERLITTYSVENCRCKKSEKRELVPCQCDGETKYQKKCIGDNTIIIVKSREVLIRGKCRRQIDKTKTKLICRSPKVVPDKCDKNTCLQRVIVLEHKAENCKCLRRLRVRQVACCCPKTAKPVTRYEGCAFNSVRVFLKTIPVQSDKANGCLEQRHRHYLETDCPSETSMKRHECRTMNLDNGNRVISARLVERTSFKVDACRCIKKQESLFEICGCPSDADSNLVKKCHPMNGVVITYRKSYKLEDGLDFNRLYSPTDFHKVKCVPYYEQVAIQHIRTFSFTKSTRKCLKLT